MDICFINLLELLYRPYEAKSVVVKKDNIVSKKEVASIIAGAMITTSLTAHIMRKRAEKISYTAEIMNPIPVRKMGFYEKYVKRALDVTCSAGAMLVFSPLYLGIAGLVKVKLGSPVLFTQDRPGLIDKNGKETIFKMYKFRTMTDERDKNGNLLPDEMRLTTFGKWLRNTSLDELPEAFNIFNGTMSVIGPRPQLVRDMTFMTNEQRARHTAKPGLSGLAQVNGRNAISWEDKIGWDLKYIQKISFLKDLSIIVKTVKKAFIKQEGITQDNMATAEDYGDYLLRNGKINRSRYMEKQEEAKTILRRGKKCIDKDDYPPFSVAMSVYGKDNPEWFDTALHSIINQTIIPNEIILVEDGPIPESIDYIIKKYQNICLEEKIQFVVIKFPNNKGLGIALKEAINSCHNEIIARMDSDDISVSTRFEEQLQYVINHPEIDIVGGNIEEFIGDKTNIVGKRIVPRTNEEIQAYMKRRCPFNHMSVMYRKSSVQNAGGYQDWFWDEDYFLWIRMWQKKSVFANTGTTLVYVRVDENMYQRRGGKKYYESEKKLQKYMLDNGMISPLLYTSNIAKRYILQVLLPNRVRAFVYQNFARKNR